MIPGAADNPTMIKKRQSQRNDSARQSYIFDILAGHVNTEVASQPGSILTLEILVPCVLVT